MKDAVLELRKLFSRAWGRTRCQFMLSKCIAKRTCMNFGSGSGLRLVSWSKPIAYSMMTCADAYSQKLVTLCVGEAQRTSSSNPTISVTCLAIQVLIILRFTFCRFTWLYTVVDGAPTQAHQHEQTDTAQMNQTIGPSPECNFTPSRRIKIWG